MITKEILEKYGFKKTENNRGMYCDDYLLDDINPEYGHFLYATISVPKKDWGRLEYNFSTIVLHRYYNYEQWIEDGDYYDTQKVFEGNIDSEEDLLFVLDRCAISPKKIKQQTIEFLENRIKEIDNELEKL